MAISFFNSEQGKYPDISEHYVELSNLYSKKLWFQFGEKLSSVIKVPGFSAGSQILDLNTSVVSKLDRELSPITYVEFGVAAAEQIEATQRTAFIEALATKVEKDQQATILCKIATAQHQLRSALPEDCKATMEATKILMDGYNDVLNAKLHSAYHKTSMLYAKALDDSTALFEHTLLFLTYTPLASLTDKEQTRIASDVALAALVGPKIYNFGELLQNPILEVLNGTEWEWLAALLFAFNKGDIGKFKTVFQVAKSQPLLQKREAFLNQKIRLLALIEMVFQRPPVDRNLTFEDIATACELKENDVEILVMKALSIGVIKGSIDQVAGRVRVTWVQPRVLDTAQMTVMRDRFGDWVKRVDDLSLQMEENAPEILNNVMAHF